MKGYSNYGGYGFWCSKSCADKKNKEKDAAQAQINQALADLDKGDNNVLIIAGIGIVLSAAILITIYKLRKK